MGSLMSCLMWLVFMLMSLSCMFKLSSNEDSGQKLDSVMKINYLYYLKQLGNWTFSDTVLKLTYYTFFNIIKKVNKCLVSLNIWLVLNYILSIFSALKTHYVKQAIIDDCKKQEIVWKTICCDFNFFVFTEKVSSQILGLISEYRWRIRNKILYI